MKLKPLLVLLILSVLGGCSSITVPLDFVYTEIHTKDFTLTGWQKITDPHAAYKIYIEGDGYAFNARGKATQDPTPRSILVRQMAFGDTHPNVVYLARPCQYIKSPVCSRRHWTTARFAPEIINAEYDAIRQIAGNNEIILVGFSGGAQIAGLSAVAKPGLNIKKVITVAGNLDHRTWTQYHHLPPLDESMNLADYAAQFSAIPQIHYVGAQDTNIPPFLTRQFVKEQNQIIIVPKATHNHGWDTVIPQIQAH